MMPLEDLKDFSMQHISNKDSKRSLFHSLSNNVNTYPSWWNSSASNCPKNTFNNTESHAQHASQVKHCFGTGIVDQDSSSTQSTDQSHQLGSSEGNLKQQCIPAQSGNDNSYDKHVDGQMKSILSLGTPEVAFQHPQIEYNSSTGCLPYTYNDQYYGSFLAAFGPRAVIYPGVWYLGFFNGLGPERTQSKMVHSALMLAGFEMEVVKTTSAGHAKKLASTVDYSSCPDGIICVGGDGIVNEVLEMGIVVDSVIIGISLGASQNSSTIKPLVAALTFHQFFEGTGLGGCIVQAKFKARKMVTMILFFSLTTPVGIAVGIGISSKYNENSPSALITQGILNSAAAGILIYMALVDLLAADFMNPRVQKKGILQAAVNVSLLVGAGLMSMLAKWA